MTDPAHPRRLQILLHDTCRGKEDLREAKRIAEEAGMTVSGNGEATLSVRISDGDFKKLFAKSKGDQLVVPDRLKPFVSSISEAPDHLSF